MADFFSYLSSPEVQADWHQFSGYLPITQAAYDLGKEQGYYDENPGTEIAIKQITLNAPTENSKGLRFGNYVQIRTIIDEEFQSLLSGDKTAAGSARRGGRARQRPDRGLRGLRRLTSRAGWRTASGRT